MQRSISGLIGYHMGATDGEIGNVEEFYFDDDTWTIRYLIVKTGNWFSGREVLISPAALVKSDWEQGTFKVNLTKEKICNSPDIDTDKPVSRQQEIALHRYYPWQSYWGTGFYPGGLWGITSSSSGIDQKLVKEADITDKQSNDDLHLRSTRQVTGYHIHATDGEIGHVKDFIMDDQTWKLVFLEVNTHNWLDWKNVLVEVQHIRDVQWSNSKVFVDLSVASIKNSTSYDEPGSRHPEIVNKIL